MKILFNLKKYLLIFILFFSFVGENAQAQFVFTPSSPLGNSAFTGNLEFMKTADLNGDGISDLVSTRQLADVRVTFLNENGGILATGTTYSVLPLGAKSKAISLSDSDADGDIDIFIASISNNVSVILTLFKNNGNGTFGAGTNFTLLGNYTAGARVLVPLDYDLDGDLDFYTVVQEFSFTAPRLIRFENTGVSYTTTTSIITGVTYNDLQGLEASVFDNASPDPELVMVMNDTNIYKISNLSGIITTTPLVVTGVSSLVDIGVTDSDLDGDNDIVIVGNGTSCSFVTMINNGTGSFMQTINTLLGANSPLPFYLLLADLDNDRDEEVIVSVQSNTAIQIYQNLAGVFATTPYSIILSSKGFGEIVVGDFNIDGKPDIASCNSKTVATDDFYTFLNTSSVASVPLTPDACFEVINNNPSPGNYATSTALSLQKERDFTVEGWFKLSNTAPTNDQYIFYVGRATTNGFGMYAEAGTQELFVTGAGGTLGTLDLKQAAVLDAWMHFALVKEKGGLWRFYLNGVQSSPLSSNTFAIPTLGGTYFGVNANSGNNMSGFLQEMRFWNTALPQKALREWAHIQPSVSHPYFFTLNSYYPLSENVGIKRNDIAYTINRTALYKFANFIQGVSSTGWSPDIAPVGDGGSGTTFNLTGNILNGRNKVGFEADFTGAGSPFPNGSVVVSRVYDTPTNPLPVPVYSKIYWVIENFSTTTNYSTFLESVTFDIKDNQFTGVLPVSIANFAPGPNPQASAFTIYSRPDVSNIATGVGGWTLVGTCNEFGSVKARKPGSVISDFGRIQLAIGVDVTILPIHLMSFSGKRINNETNVIEWITTFEYKNQLFEIEKSFDAKEFFRIGTEKPTNKATITSYSFTDKYATEAAYYRLKQYDEDGKVNYSKTIFINNTKESGFEDFTIYPNPATDEIKLKITGIDNSKAMIMQVFGTMGTKILDISGNLSEIEQMLNQNLSKIPFGLYMIQIQTENKIMKTKFIKK